MSRPERLLLLVFFVVVLVVVGSTALVSTVLGAVAGAVPAVLVGGKLRRVGGRSDAGAVEPRRRGVRPANVGLRAALHLGVLGLLLATTFFVPFVGDEIYAASAAFVTAFAAILTAARLRR